jgi:repressor LexA
LKDPSIKVPRALDRYFVLSKDSEEAALAPLIEKFYEEEKLRLQQEVRTTEEEIHELSAGKVTAAVRKKIETREKKRERLIGKQGQGILDISPLDERIYPFYYAPVIAEGKSGRRLVPMRYRVRRPDGGEVPGQYNVFNARIDSLESAKTWKPLFGKNHAIFPFRLFYEWVERDGGKREISFSPEDRSLMWAASIFIYTASPSGPLLSFAMVTDDPPPEVSAGYLDMDANSKRGVSLKQSGCHVPLLGKVAAGAPIEYHIHQEFVEVPSSFLRLDSEHYCLVVQGDSMIGAGILDGDYAVIRKQEQADEGTVVVASVDGLATLKKIFRKKNQVELHAANPKYAPLVITPPAQLRIEGVLTGVLRNLNSR